MLCFQAVLGKPLAFILLIGPLIFIHELGHLIAAKLVDVKVERFSIGLGPALLKLKLGETEYVLAPIPLGGYVSMLGQRPGEELPAAEADRALSSKPLWARYLVLGAGPLANLVLPVFVLFFYFVISLTKVTPAVLGTVNPGSAAAAAGLQQGDRIVAIDGRDVRSWSEMSKRVSGAAGKELEVQIDRDGKRLDRVITPEPIIVRNSIGVAETRGRLGVLNIFYTPQIGIVDRESPAFQVGLRTGDIITSINGEPVRTIEELEHLLALEARRDAVLRLTYLRPSGLRTSLATFVYHDSHHALILPRRNEMGEVVTGILPARAFVRSVDPGSAADKAGIEPGDRIISIDGAPFLDWLQLDEKLGQKPDVPIRFELQSPGEAPRAVDVTLGRREWKDRFEEVRSRPWLGAHPYDKYDQAPPEPLDGRFTYALAAAFEETISALSFTWSVLVQMVTFERGLESLSSPIGIYKVAGIVYEDGPGEFLMLFALLSVNVGIVNLLPIPVLDGGNMMLFTVEAIRRRPLGQRAREITGAIGLFIIIVLFFIAARNDIMRHWL